MPKATLRIASLAFYAAVSVTIVACGDPSQGTSLQAPPTGETPSPLVPSLTSLPTATPGPDVATQSVTLDSTAWLAGFKVRVTGADLDPSRQTVDVTAVLTNTSQVDASLAAVTGEVSLDPGDGSSLISVQQVQPGANVVAGASARTAISFTAAAPIDLSTATLMLGTVAHHQWRVPLSAGTSAIGEDPLSVTSPHRLTTGHAFLDIASAQVVPWSCTGITPYTAFIPSDRSTSVIAIRGSAGAMTVPAGGTAIETMTVTAPDGTTASVITPPLKVWFAHQSTPDILLCLPVPAGMSGNYVLTITDSQRASVAATLTVPRT